MDECALRRDNCKENEVCENTPGSYKCPCRPGYYKESKHHECMKGKGHTIVDKNSLLYYEESILIFFIFFCFRNLLEIKFSTILFVFVLCSIVCVFIINKNILS